MRFGFHQNADTIKNRRPGSSGGGDFSYAVYSTAFYSFFMYAHVSTRTVPFDTLFNYCIVYYLLFCILFDFALEKLSVIFLDFGFILRFKAVCTS